MTDLGPGFEILLQTLVLFILLLGLAGLMIPIFPGLTVMWLAVTVYALVEHANLNMYGIDWTLYALITVLMIGGNIVDNIIMARKMREASTPWSSIAVSYLAGIVASIFLTPLTGLLAAPLALYAAEYFRLRDRRQALTSTKAYVTGFGWGFAARFSIGVLMTGLWMLWAWF